MIHKSKNVAVCRTFAVINHASGETTSFPGLGENCVQQSYDGQPPDFFFKIQYKIMNLGLIAARDDIISRCDVKGL